MYSPNADKSIHFGVFTRDVDPDNPTPGPQDERFIDESITVTYRRGRGMARLLFVAGPEPDQLRVVMNIGQGEPSSRSLAVGQQVELQPSSR